jgi:Transposase IS116/IS110/IS902 family
LHDPPASCRSSSTSPKRGCPGFSSWLASSSRPRVHCGRRCAGGSCRRCATARWRQSEPSGWPAPAPSKARTQATNQLKALIVTGLSGFRQQLRHLSTPLIIAHCARLRPRPDLRDPEQATKTALRRLVRRHQQLSEEITDHELHQLVRDVAPALLGLPGVRSEVAGQVLISIGDNADRLKSEAAFVHLCGAAPIPASSGRTHRHRLNRGGDRSANNAPLRSRSRPHATRRSHPRIRRETNPRRASQARNHPPSQALRCPRDLQHTQSGDASTEARTTTCQTIGASTRYRDAQ